MNSLGRVFRNPLSNLFLLQRRNHNWFIVQRINQINQVEDFEVSNNLEVKTEKKILTNTLISKFDIYQTNLIRSQSSRKYRISIEIEVIYSLNCFTGLTNILQ
ncbi:unnamed protein product [Paramecium octaurelia]|uniref:Uncharacterized protein n=1 Tax=Paramecium octaurelia TaxID=43137 RepID=A0A8S1VYA1_PAROT|nr:unnamed protein product [Paramecium octaurelia]